MCRARHLIENTFGIFVNRWQIFHRTIFLDADNVVEVVKACIVLHNYLQCPSDYAAPEEDTTNLQPMPDNEDLGLQDVRFLRGNRASNEAARVRNTFCDYFMSDVGRVNWQYRMCHVEE